MKRKTCIGFGAVAAVSMFLILLSAGFDQAHAKTAPALASPAGARDDGHNAEGIKHYNKGHWKKAADHFRGAINSDPDLAEAHYNLALALDKMGQHGPATRSFAKALKLGKDNPDISGSGILKAHLR
ncbi:MAG: tetratricopeptide repeat protein [Nitrospiria bacterium]